MQLASGQCQRALHRLQPRTDRRGSDRRLALFVQPDLGQQFMLGALAELPQRRRHRRQQPSQAAQRQSELQRAQRRCEPLVHPGPGTRGPPARRRSVDGEEISLHAAAISAPYAPA
ncbi:MAG: hypothetical protein KDF63_07080 [Rhodoferax sp.]|nr:hypothetical protein [Rhodoferax sp.]